MTKPFNPQVLKTIFDSSERQQAAVEAFNYAIENKDDDSAREVCRFVIDDESESNHIFSVGFQLHCLEWLTRYYHHNLTDNEEGNSGEDTAADGLFYCIWVSKWIISHLPLDLNLSLQEIEDGNRFIQEIYQAFSQAAVAKVLMHQSILMGNAEAARQHFQQWQTQNKDESSDCEACEQDSLIEYHHFTGNYTKAIELAEPILAGRLTCAEVPHVTYAHVIDSLIHIGDHDRASALLKRAEKHLTGAGKNFYFLLAPLAALHNKLGETEAAAELLDGYSDVMVNTSKNNAMYYLDYLTAVATFNEEARTKAYELAKAFDERNGNSHYQTKLDFLFSAPTLH